MDRLILVTFMLVMSSCSSIMSGTTQKVTITSNINGCDIRINGNSVGKTPTTVRIKREDRMHLIVTKSGYEDYNTTMETKLDPWFWGNIILGGVIGSTTDFALGSTHLLDPDTIHIQMYKKGKNSSFYTPNNDPDKISDKMEFAIINFLNLEKQIMSGSGEHFEALLSLMGLKDSSERKNFLSHIQKVVIRQPTSLQFSQAVESYKL